MKKKERPVYSSTGMPLILIQNACRVREGGKHCSAYEHKVEMREGVKADVYYCHGNPIFCDYAMGIALQLSDKSSGLYKKVLAKSK